MDESNNTDVAAVLLSFSTLGKAQRDDFTTQFNEFLYASSQQKRKLMRSWLKACRDCANPVAHMVAESMAQYVVHDRKPAKRRRRKSKANDNGDASTTT